MNENNDKQKQAAGACGPGCGCETSGSGSRGRWVVGVIVLLVAGVLVVRAMVKDSGAQANQAAPGFTDPTAPVQTAATNEQTAVSDTVVGKEIGAFAELNALTLNVEAVFVYLPGKDETSGKVPASQINGAVRTLESQGRKVGIFTLKRATRDYDQIAAQVAVPNVLALVKGRGMNAVSGDITEPKLIQAFVAASSAGCGPSAGAGCCPK